MKSWDNPSAVRGTNDQVVLIRSLAPTYEFRVHYKWLSIGTPTIH